MTSSTLLKLASSYMTGTGAGLAAGLAACALQGCWQGVRVFQGSEYGGHGLPVLLHVLELLRVLAGRVPAVLGGGHPVGERGLPVRPVGPSCVKQAAGPSPYEWVSGVNQSRCRRL